MFERLIKLVRNEKVSLFIGAGFSIETGAPSVSKLKQLILDQFDDDNQKDEHEKDALDELSEFFVENICGGSRNDLITMMKEAFTFNFECMNDHKMLAQIPHFHNIFTTNYDTTLEASYSNNEINIVRTDKDCAYLTKATTIFKVHGDFTDPDSVVLTKNDYSKFKKKCPNPSMWNMVENEFLTKHILFIGYSLNDDNIIDIINAISKNINRNQKQMFLIAPSLSKSKKEQLRKMKVEYYDSFASTFLKELTKELAENVSDDFRHGKLSPATYARYCHLHKYLPKITIGENGENKIEGVSPIDKNGFDEKIIFTVGMDCKPMFDSMDFAKYGEIVEDSPYHIVPCFKLSGENLLRCSHMVNGVVQNNNFKSLIVGPTEQKMTLSFKINDSDFFELLEASCFRLNCNTLLIFADCHIYTITFTVTLLERNCTINFRLDFKKIYTDNDMAIKWIEFPIALFSNKEVAIPELLGKAFTFSQMGQTIPQHNFLAFKEYYKNVKFIECKTGSKFSKYYGCTEDNYNISRKIVAFLKHECITEQYEKDGFTFSATDIQFGEFNQSVKVNEIVSIVKTETSPVNVTLNDRRFCFPYTHYIYNTCIVKGIQPNEKGQLKIDFQYPQSTYQVLYSNKVANIEFPQMKPFTDLVTNKAKLQFNG